MTDHDSTSSGRHYELDHRSSPPQPPQTPPAQHYHQPVPPTWNPAPMYAPQQMAASMEPPGQRPPVVTAAGITILGTVVLALVGGAMLLIPDSTVDDSDRTFMAISGGVHLAIAVGFIAVALGVLQGRNGGRITAFVIYGIAILINGCLGFLLLLMTGTEEETLPWQGITFTVIMLLLMIADVVVIVLLALTPASRWFRAMSQARRLGIQ